MTGQFCVVAAISLVPPSPHLEFGELLRHITVRPLREW